MKLYGFEISIENAKGTTRKWYDPHGKESGSTYMHCDYGYIRGTEGTDGDHVDVYIGPHHDSDRAFVIDQMKKPGFTEFDEQKVMLAFRTAEEAKKAYLRQYNDKRFFGSMKEMSMDEFKQKVLDRKNRGKKVAGFVALNLARGLNDLILPHHIKSAQIMGSPGGVDAVPPQTGYGNAVTTKADRIEASQEVKVAGGDRVGAISDRIDDAGIGLLAAPYLAQAGGKVLAKFKNPKLQAAGAGLSNFGRHIEHSHGREIAGLAMVAPGVTHAVARGIDKAMPSKKLEKVAEKLFPDFEYKTEQEKTAILAGLGRLAGDLVHAGSQLRPMAAQVVSRAGGMKSQISPMAAKLVDGAKGRLQGAVSGAQNAVSRQLAGAKDSYNLAKAGLPPTRVPTPQPKVTASVTAPISHAHPGHTPAPALSANAPVVPAAAPATKSKWNPATAKNLALGAGAVGVGGAAYGGYKGIQTTASMLQNHHEAPLVPPGFVGAGRVF
jgi:hypothetical protein